MREAPGAADHRHPAGMPYSYKLIADTKVSDVAVQSGKPGIGTGSLNRNYARRTGTPGAARSALPWQCGQYVLLASLPQCQQPPLQRQCQYGLFCPGTDISMQNFWRVPVPRRGAYPRVLRGVPAAGHHVRARWGRQVRGVAGSQGDCPRVWHRLPLPHLRHPQAGSPGWRCPNRAPCNWRGRSNPCSTGCGRA